MAERWETINYRISNEGYRPEHSSSGYCDACNLPMCLRACNNPPDAENPAYNYMRGPDQQWAWYENRLVKIYSKGLWFDSQFHHKDNAPTENKDQAEDTLKDYKERLQALDKATVRRMIEGKESTMADDQKLDLKAEEDADKKMVDGWPEIKQAIVYFYLHASGQMNLEKAKRVIAKARND